MRKSGASVNQFHFVANHASLRRFEADSAVFRWVAAFAKFLELIDVAFN